MAMILPLRYLVTTWPARTVPAQGCLLLRRVAPPCAEAAVGTQGQPGQGMGTLT